jgi:hypothetical protein
MAKKDKDKPQKERMMQVVCGGFDKKGDPCASIIEKPITAPTVYCKKCKTTTTYFIPPNPDRYRPQPIPYTSEEIIEMKKPKFTDKIKIPEISKDPREVNKQILQQLEEQNKILADVLRELKKGN